MTWADWLIFVYCEVAGIIALRQFAILAHNDLVWNLQPPPPPPPPTDELGNPLPPEPQEQWIAPIWTQRIHRAKVLVRVVWESAIWLPILLYSGAKEMWKELA